jgi:hypothetical protein
LLLLLLLLLSGLLLPPRLLLLLRQEAPNWACCCGAANTLYRQPLLHIPALAAAYMPVMRQKGAGTAHALQTAVCCLRW